MAFPPDTEDRSEGVRWATFHAGTLLVGAALAATASARWGQDVGERVAFGYFGAMFLLAASGRSRRAWQAIRRTGWFAAVPPAALRAILVLFGALFLYVAAFDQA